MIDNTHLGIRGGGTHLTAKAPKGNSTLKEKNRFEKSLYWHHYLALVRFGTRFGSSEMRPG